MLISKRRLRCSAIALLVICLVLLMPPTRNWVHSFLVTQLVSPQVTVGELFVHSERSVVEVRDFRWNTDEDQGLQLAARRAWFGYDGSRLAEPRSCIDKVLLQDTMLHLNRVPPPAVNLQELCMHRAAQHMQQLDWALMRQQLESLNATENLKAACANRVEAYTGRAQQLAVEIEQLERQTAGMDNPLRFELVIREKLIRFQELGAEQENLCEYFNELSRTMRSELAELQALHRKDQLILAGLVIGNSASRELPPQSEANCTLLAEDFGRAFWQRIACYGEVIDRLSHSTRGFLRPGYDVDIRSRGHRDGLSDVADWKVSGDFFHGSSTVAFRAFGKWSVTQPTRRPSRLDLACQALFFCDDANIAVQAAHTSQRSAATRLVLRQFSAGRPVPTVTLLPKREPESSLGRATLHIDLISKDDVVRGRLSVARDAVAQLMKDRPGALPGTQLDSDAEAVTSGGLDAAGNDTQALVFDVHGRWSRADVRLAGPLPVWLRQLSESAVSDCAEKTAAANEMRLGNEFQSEFDELERWIAEAVTQGQALAATHQRQLLAAQAHLQQQLSDINGGEFARRPGAISR